MSEVVLACIYIHIQAANVVDYTVTQYSPQSFQIIQSICRFVEKEKMFYLNMLIAGISIAYITDKKMQCLIIYFN